MNRSCHVIITVRLIDKLLNTPHYGSLLNHCHATTMTLNITLARGDAGVGDIVGDGRCDIVKT